EQIFGRREVRDDGRSTPKRRTAVPRGRTFRTMCVRTCDGYYFPISFSTTSSYFDSDADACNQRCPAAQTELFYHAMPAGSPEEMVSHPTGEGYTSKPFAFKYREEKVENCSCTGGPRNFETIAGESLRPDDGIKDFPNGQSADADGSLSFVLPDWRPEPDASPEKQLNAVGNLTLAKARALLAKPDPQGDTVAGTQERTIRLVGPKFFPDQ
ncbi:MAG: DUF2865 domain-containing protein, partial [Pseudomonadota bacterium]